MPDLLLVYSEISTIVKVWMATRVPYSKVPDFSAIFQDGGAQLNENPLKWSCNLQEVPTPTLKTHRLIVMHLLVKAYYNAVLYRPLDKVLDFYWISLLNLCHNGKCNQWCWEALHMCSLLNRKRSSAGVCGILDSVCSHLLWWATRILLWTIFLGNKVK